MKKTISVKLLAAGLCVVLAGTTAYGLHYSKPLNTKGIVAHAEDQKETAQEDTSSGEGTVDKNESVFVTTDAAGTPTDIIVSDWLDNTNNYKTINDKTTLAEVENVKSNNTITQDGSDLTIDAKGSDIYYRGNLDASTTLPVSLTVNYTLDGSKIDAADLDGATGHLVMTITYTNNTSVTETVEGKEYKVCVPFLATSIMAFDTDNVTNMQAQNGKVLETGTKCVFAGFGFPGVNESYGLDDNDGVFTNSASFEADVTDYSPQMIMSYYSTAVFSDSDLDSAVNTEDIMNAFTKITNISTDKFDNIKNMDDIKEAMDTLKASASDLNDGMVELQTGVGELDAKVALLNDGMHQAYDGTTQLADAISQAATSTAKLNAGAKSVSEGATQLDAGVDQLLAGMTTLTAEIDKGIATYGAVNSDTATSIANDFSSYQTKLGTANVIGALMQTQAKIAEAAAASNETTAATLTAINATIETNIDTLASAAGINKADVTSIIAASQTIDANGMTPAQAYMYNFGATEQSIGAATALNTIKTGLDDKHMSASLAALKSGSSQLASGAKQVYTGTGQLLTGLNTLSSKTNELADALKQLSDGTDLLKDGTSQLVDGTSQLADGTSQLATMFDGDTSALINTSTALKNAAVDYNIFTAASKDSNSKVSFIIKTE